MEEFNTLGGPESRDYDADNEVEAATGVDVDMGNTPDNAAERATGVDVDVKTPE